jgi:multiple antibiotic resistance protein
MKKNVKEDALTRSDIALTPLALPMLAGPGAISLLITYNQSYLKLTDHLIVVGSVVAISIVTFLLLNISRKISKVLGASGMNSLSRIIGFIVIAIGVEFILSSLLNLTEHIVK